MRTIRMSLFFLGLTVATTATADMVPYCSLYARGPQQAWQIGGASVEDACARAELKLSAPYTIGRRAQGYFDDAGLNHATVECFGACYELHDVFKVEGLGYNVFVAAQARIGPPKGCIITVTPPNG